MMGVDLLTRGIVAGFLIAAPVGPVNVMCISRTLNKGWKSGLVSGLGAAAADTFYGSIAGFSITFLIQLLLREEFWVRLVGGILLMFIGAVYFFRKAQPIKDRSEDGAGKSDYASTFALTLTNPTTVLSFLAVLAALGMGGQRPWWLTSILVGGVFLGSMFWWIILVSVATLFRDRFTDRTMVWMNRIAGMAMGGFGLITAALGILHRR
jgi:threonine/homoserine/homoserine lactone efflux protein